MQQHRISTDWEEIGEDDRGHETWHDTIKENQAGTIDGLNKEIHELHNLNDRLTDILQRVATAIKGEPDHLTLHSWHDLPEQVSALVPRIEK